MKNTREELVTLSNNISQWLTEGEAILEGLDMIIDHLSEQEIDRVKIQQES